MIVPDFKIRSNLENINITFRKTKMEKKIGCAGKNIGWKK